jgi:hypothetical protein
LSALPVTKFDTLWSPEPAANPAPSALKVESPKGLQAFARGLSSLGQNVFYVNAGGSRPRNLLRTEGNKLITFLLIATLSRRELNRTLLRQL